MAQPLDDDPPAADRPAPGRRDRPQTLSIHLKYTSAPDSYPGGTNEQKLRCHISVSLDGFVAGPDQSKENPLGEGGERLHHWVVPLAAWREAHGHGGGTVDERADLRGGARERRRRATGRNMFGPIGGGPWRDDEWKGWWGDEPPYHYPVLAVTHHPRDPVEMQGGTTYHFATDGIEAALERAKEAAGGKDVMLYGGAQVVNEYLAAGLLDVLELHVVPCCSGGGARLFDDLGPTCELEQVRGGRGARRHPPQVRGGDVSRAPLAGFSSPCGGSGRQMPPSRMMMLCVVGLDAVGA